MKPLSYGMLLAVTWMAPLAHGADPWQPGVEFAADVLRTYSAAPERSTQGKMYVSAHGVRTEGVLNGKKVVMLFHPSSKEAWMLLPEQKQFMRQTGMEMRRPPLPDEAESPCRTNKAYACRNLETVTLDGRAVQRWEVVVNAGEKAASRATLWVDQKLKLAVREEYSDGLKVELRAIREEAQSPDLFKVPDGFKEVALTREPPQEGGASAPVARPPLPPGRPAPPGKAPPPAVVSPPVGAPPVGAPPR